MKIAYFLEIDSYVNSGVIKKINHQILHWRESFHEVEVFVIWPNDTFKKHQFLKSNHYYNNFIDKWLPKNFIGTYFTKIMTVGRAKRAISRFDPDVLYFRQGIWYPGLIGLLKNCIGIMELNTVDSFEKKFYSPLRRLIYSFGRSKILNKTDALVAVSPAILKHYEEFDIPKTVVSNGIILGGRKKKNPNNNKPLTAVFVGSSGMQWHGLRYVFKLAEYFKEITFKIVGYNEEAFPDVQLSNVHFLGWLDKDELSQVYTSSHIAIASFGNHMVGKSEDSTLKVREYLAFGLPVLLGHNDTDFIDSPFVFNCTDEDHNLLPKEQIEVWIKNYKDIVVQESQIECIDSAVKEKARLEFFSEVNKRCSHKIVK